MVKTQCLRHFGRPEIVALYAQVWLYETAQSRGARNCVEGADLLGLLRPTRLVEYLGISWARALNVISCLIFEQTTVFTLAHGSVSIH